MELGSEVEYGALRLAQAALQLIEERAERARYDELMGGVDGFDLGKLDEACEAASEALFNVLSTAGIYCKDDVAEAVQRPLGKHDWDEDLDRFERAKGAAWTAAHE